MQTLNLEIPEDIIEDYQTLENIKKIVFEDFVICEYQKGNLSIRQGAQLLNLTYSEFIQDFLGKHKIPLAIFSEDEQKQQEHWLDELLKK